jgi:hypothetical protein
MTGEADLISLLYRADWTRLTLAAELSDGSSLLVAPGRRYRRQDGEAAWGCDGVHPWEPVPGEMAGQNYQWITKIEAPLSTLLCPAWLLASSRLEVLGPAQACGRDALRVLMTRRPGIRGRAARPYHVRTDRAEVIVDAGLGILLRLEWLAGEEPGASRAGADDPDRGDEDDESEPVVTEFVGLDLDPVIDPAQFAPPPGSQIGKSLGEILGGGGAAGWALRTAGGMAAGGLGALIKHTAHRDDEPQAAGAAFPPADPAPALSPDGLPPGPPVSAGVLHLLHDSGTAGFAARLHEWLDASALVAQVPAGAQRAGFGGLGLLVRALADGGAVAHRVSALRIDGLGRYRIDHADEPDAGPKTIICDEEHRWQVYGDKVTVGPAESAPPEMADLADPSWLLECRLSGGDPITVSGRPAFRVTVARAGGPWSPTLLWCPAAVAAVDTELGILLQLTTYADGRPVRRYELRDVTTEAGEFRADLPPGLPVVEDDEEDLVRRFRDGHPPRVNIFQAAASAAGRQVATEASKAARNLLRRLNGR